ncbi:MAG TPA: 4'-phosphopantetheinyl transferase superfamily protein [Xanthomonadaceae bacterium]|nr:4'-phosphopantetheinyl transferase superfamily protein [Xanthomonadaceae bacterium]
MEVLIRLSHIDIEAPQAEAMGDAWLASGERVRLGRMRSADVRRRFVAGHWLARKGLAEFAGGVPEDWLLGQDDGGAPLAVHADGRTSPQLSISHSGDLLVCAVASAAVGVDVEAPGPARDLARLASMVFGEAERTSMQALDAAAREAYFYPRWTLREAWLKCRRCGLAPARMRSLRLLPVDSDAEARTWRAERAWLALSGAPGMRVTMAGASGFQADAMWRIEEG